MLSFIVHCFHHKNAGVCGRVILRLCPSPTLTVNIYRVKQSSQLGNLVEANIHCVIYYCIVPLFLCSSSSSH